MRTSIVVLLAALAAGSLCWAQPSLEVSAPDRGVSVGDRVPVRVIARGGDDLLWGDLTVRIQPAGPWEVVDGPRPISGAHPPAWEVVLAPMAVGSEPLPEIEVTARREGAEPILVKPADLPEVVVASVLPADEEAEPAPMRDPVGVSGFPWEWVLPVLVGLMPFAGLLAWWILRRKPTADDDPTLRLPPFDQLEELLGQLMTSVGREPAEGVCDRLAQGFRRFIERRSGEPALEMTSHELRGVARANRWPEDFQRSLHHVMQIVDGVRFGKRRVADSELEGAIEAAADAGRELEAHFTRSEETPEVAA